MNEKNKNLIKIHEELFREIRERRSLVLYIVTRLSIITFIIIGWKIVQTNSAFSHDIKLFLSIFIGILSVILTYSLFYIYKEYKTIASVITKISEILGLFKNDIYLKNAAIYPKTWKGFGEKRLTQMFWVAYPLLLGSATIIILWLK